MAGKSTISEINVAIEHQEILKSGLDVTFHSVATGKLRRYFSWQNMLDVFKVGWGIVQSLFIMLRLVHRLFFQREALSQYRLLSLRVCPGVPVFIHESDLSMGLANKIAYKFATKMYSTFEQASSLSKVEHVGAVTKVSDQKIQNPMNWWIFKPTLIPNYQCIVYRWFCWCSCL